MFSRRLLAQTIRILSRRDGVFAANSKSATRGTRIHSISDVDYHEAHLYALVVRLESFRTLISIAALFNLELRQFDVLAAYPHGDIDGEVYIEPPPVHKKNGTVWLLLKGLYGLKRAGRICNERFKANMEELGFVQCPRDGTVLRVGTRRSDDWAACTFWVDGETGIGSPTRTSGSNV